MAMATNRNSRTLRVYVSDLLEYPRWIIEREVDFTDCSYAGHCNAFLPECVHCKFGRGCHWLDQQRTPDIADAPLVELIEALEGAVEYLQSTKRQDRTDEDDVRDRMREARRFLRSRT